MYQTLIIYSVIGYYMRILKFMREYYLCYWWSCKIRRGKPCEIDVFLKSGPYTRLFKYYQNNFVSSFFDIRKIKNRDVKLLINQSQKVVIH